MSDDRVPPHPLDARWHLKVGDDCHGPYSGHQMIGFMAEGRVTSESMVSSEKDGPWRRVAEDPVLGASVGKTAPAAIEERPKEKRDKIDGLIVVAHISYALLLFGGLITWIILPVIGLIVAYVSRPDARGTWLESHFTWQIRTFWLYLLVGTPVLLILVLMALVGPLVNVGWLLFLPFAIWIIYRCVKGWLRLGRKRAMS